MLASRSAKISGASNVYSWPVHFVWRRQESILLPHAFVVSDAHFVKFAPHFSVIQSRRALSHALAVVILDEPVAAFALFSPWASSNARWRAIVSASALADESGAAPPMSAKTLLNMDVLLSTIITGSGAGSGVVMIVGSDSGAVVMVVSDWLLFVIVGIRVPVDGVRFCVRAAAASVAVVGRDVVAALAIFATAIIASIEQL